MEKQTQKLLDTSVRKQRLVPLLKWADEVTADSPSNLSPVAKRAIANANVNAYAFAYTFAYNFANANDFALAYGNGNGNANIFANAYGNADTYANRMMVECKKAALQVSPETWERIESRMLKP